MARKLIAVAEAGLMANLVCGGSADAVPVREEESVLRS